MKDVLWISFRVPYDNVAHAGGKIHNFYLKKLKNKDVCNIKLISFYNDSDSSKIDLDRYGIDSILINSTDIEKRVPRHKIEANRIYKISGVNQYLDLITRTMCIKALDEIKKLKNLGYVPQVIILQWTQIIALLPELKRCFPNTKFVCIEEDVTFLAAQRRSKLTSNAFKKAYFLREEKCIKKIEKNCLERSDLVILNNRKDEKLLAQSHINTKTWVWTPYFQNMIDLKRTYTGGKDILFYGAMSRPENWMSAIWFIENVFTRLKSKGYRFIVIGNKPNEKLLKYDDGNQIRILGFVEDISPYFQNALCLAAPLLLGAGVKIKILEGMSSGIPVITNSIGIEGIYAKNGEEYFYCENPDDYILTIEKLSQSIEKNLEIGQKAKQYMQDNYDYNKDAEVFGNLIKELCEGVNQLHEKGDIIQ